MRLLQPIRTTSDAQPRHLTPAVAISVAVHASVIVAILFFVSHAREKKTQNVTQLDPVKLVWIPNPRPAGRGGGGAPPKPTPPPPTPTPAVSVPSHQNQSSSRSRKRLRRSPSPCRTRRLPRQPSPPAIPPRGHNQRGLAINLDRASAIDSGPGSGDEPYGIGNGVTAPIPLRRPPPAYTAEAMRARLQGVVVLNCVVRPDGKCSDIRILKSLDTMFGLDQQADRVPLREWVFRPGMRMGQPVPVLVTLEIGFTIPLTPSLRAPLVNSANTEQRKNGAERRADGGRHCAAVIQVIHDHECLSAIPALVMRARLDHSAGPTGRRPPQPFWHCSHPPCVPRLRVSV